jgi:hypothetical protein
LAGADELFREAQHALQNVSPGSTDERRNIARAKSYALQVVRKYPRSMEADLARKILARLDIKDAARPQAARGGRPLAFSFDKPTPYVATKEKVSHTMDRFAAIASTDDQWRNIGRRFIALPKGKKKLLAISLLVLIAMAPFSLFILSGLAVVYALNLPILKRHLHGLLNSLESTN